jgi:hypothetical protein
MIGAMDGRDWMAGLRGAAYRRDGAAVVALARDEGRPAGVLQLLGDGLAVALAQRVDERRWLFGVGLDAAGPGLSGPASGWRSSRSTRRRSSR